MTWKKSTLDRIRLLMPIMAMTLAVATHPAQAHDTSLVAIQATFLNDGTFRIEIKDDVAARLLGVPPGKTTEADLRRLRLWSPQQRQKAEKRLFRFLHRHVKLRFDETKVSYRIEMPCLDALAARPPPNAPGPGQFIRLTGTVPAGAQSFRLFCSKALGNVVLTLRHEGGPQTIQRLTAGGYSELYPIEIAVEPQGALAVSRTFLILGYKHILPLGWDHIAFVLCLFLLSSRLKPLTWQVTAFTVAHSITLSLAVLGVVSLSQAVIGRIVEPLIAVSIAFVAVENLFTDKLKPWRPVVVFAFGLLHGLGFASVLLQLGIPNDRYINALASFNVGVELGQLTIIALAFFTIGRFRNTNWYRPRIVLPTSAAIALLGLCVAINRFTT